MLEYLAVVAAALAVFAGLIWALVHAHKDAAELRASLAEDAEKVAHKQAQKLARPGLHGPRLWGRWRARARRRELRESAEEAALSAGTDPVRPAPDRGDRAL